jgi:beta-lactamase class A
MRKRCSRGLLPLLLSSALSLALLTTAAAQSGGQPPVDPAQQVLFQKMVAAIESLAARSDGVLSVSVMDLREGTRYSLRGDQVFAVASTIKLAILFELFRQADQGLLSLTDTQAVPARELIDGSPILGGLLSFTPQPAMPLRKYSLRELAVFMIVTSDNTATNALIDRLGFAAVNDLCARLGLQKTRLRRKMLDAAAVLRGQENTATANELAALLQQVHRVPWRYESSRTELLRILSLPKESYFSRGLPADMPLASKLGSLGGVRAEVALIPLPERPFVLSAIVAYAGDGLAAERTLADVAAAASGYFAAVATHTAYGRSRPSP